MTLRLLLINVPRGFFLSLVLWLSFTLAAGMGQTPSYHFQSDTVWGKVTVVVTDLNGRFKIEAQSDSTSTRWMLKDSQGHKVAQGTLDSSNHLKTQVPFPFQKPFQLTILVKGDQGEVPVV